MFIVIIIVIVLVIVIVIVIEEVYGYGNLRGLLEASGSLWEPLRASGSSGSFREPLGAWELEVSDANCQIGVLLVCGDGCPNCTAIPSVYPLGKG